MNVFPSRPTFMTTLDTRAYPTENRNIPTLPVTTKANTCFLGAAMRCLMVSSHIACSMCWPISLLTYGLGEQF